MNRRKDLIKNIAIVFLAVMLVLTFFSNTILNWSLPEVSGKYTEYGEIKTGVRGSGSVVSNMTYTETIKGERKIEEVYVSRGTPVVAGQTLMLLGPTDTDKAEALEAEIEGLEDTYNRALLSKTEYDYSSDEYDIEIATEELEALKLKLGIFSEESLKMTNEEGASLEKSIKETTALIKTLEEQLEEATENSEDPDITALRAERDKAKEMLDIAKEALEKAEEALKEVTSIDTSSIDAQLESLYETLDSLQTDLKYLEEDSADLLKIKADMTAAEKAYNDAVATYGEDSPKAALAKSEYDTALALYETNKDEIKTAERAITAKKTAIEDTRYYIREANANLSAANRENKDWRDRNNTVNIKKKAVETEEKNLEAKEKALADAVSAVNKELTTSLKTAKKSLEKMTETKAELDEISTIRGQIKAKERSLTEMKSSLEKKKESDKKTAELENYDLNKQYKAIQDKKAELASIRGNSKEGYELKASRSGTVTEVSFRAGEIATDGAAALVIEVVESGYTLSFSVSNNEATRLNIGDAGNVSGTYWGQSVGAVLSKITPDAGGKTKTLTFDLTGDVNVGQNLTVVVGERSTGYSSVIPKSALHEDANGKFIYITKTKSTPLGDRFVATRLDVTVAASDDKNVAITTDEAYLYEYLITSSTKPFEEGDYVRLSD